MGKYEKLLLNILQGESDANISFSTLCGLLDRYGFELRIKGDHHIFTRPDMNEIINLQPLKGKVKVYQIKQIRKILIKYKMDTFYDE